MKGDDKMAIKTQEELLNSIKGLLKDDTSDESIALLEDVTDTLAEMSTNKDNENWKQKYEDNDKQWRQKYRDRFFNTGSDEGSKLDARFDPEPEPEPVKKTFEDLFTTKE